MQKFGTFFQATRYLYTGYALVAISNGMQVVKLCTNKIVQFLTGGAG